MIVKLVTQHWKTTASSVDLHAVAKQALVHPLQIHLSLAEPAIDIDLKSEVVIADVQCLSI
jgi:hypothetical protein